MVAALWDLEAHRKGASGPSVTLALLEKGNRKRVWVRGPPGPNVAVMFFRDNDGHREEGREAAAETTAWIRREGVPEAGDLAV